MKTVCIALALLFSACPVCLAQGFSLDLIPTGGGARSTGATYSLEGHIGTVQPDRLQGGAYSLESEFFATPGGAVSEDVELLTSFGNGRLAVLWDRAATGFVLETTPSLSGVPGWVVVESPPETNATHFFVFIPVSDRHQFFRLRRR